MTFYFLRGSLVLLCSFLITFFIIILFMNLEVYYFLIEGIFLNFPSVALNCRFFVHPNHVSWSNLSRFFSKANKKVIVSREWKRVYSLSIHKHAFTFLLHQHCKFKKNMHEGAFEAAKIYSTFSTLLVLDENIGLDKRDNDDAK